MTFGCRAQLALVLFALGAGVVEAREHGVHKHHSHSHGSKKSRHETVAPEAATSPAAPATPTEGESAPVPETIRPPPPPVDTAAAEAYQAGVAEIVAGHLEAAIPLLLKAAQTSKPEPKIWYLLGRAYGRLNRFEDGRVALRKYISIEPMTNEGDIASKLLKDFDVLESTGFLITSVPTHAEFTLDTPTGPRTPSPGVLHAEPGAHKIYVTLEGYEPQIIEESTRAGDQLPVTATLVPLGCDLMAEVLVPTAGATVSVGEGAAESVPGPVRVPRGRHDVEIRPVGGAPIARQMVCKNNEPLKVSVSVPPPTTGRIAVNLAPGARAIVDGTELKAEGNRAASDLVPGEHLLDVEAEGKIAWHTAVVVRPGEALDVTPTLEAGGGATGIEVRSDPTSAAISIDGREAKSGEMLKVQPGKHQIDVRALGHKPVTRMVEVIAGERSHVEVRLEERSRYLLWLGLGAIPFAAAAEGLGLAGHENAAGELANSTQWQRWHTLELSGQIVAGAAALVAVGALAGYAIQLRVGDPNATRVGTAVTPAGGTVAVMGNF